jgi:hypothetical protein
MWTTRVEAVFRVDVQVLSEPRPGKARNEDLAGFVGDAAWVLDGASAPARSDGGHGAEWYVRRLSGALAQALSELETPLPDVVERAIAAVVRDAGPGVTSWPAATLTVVRRQEASLDYLILGDSPLLVQGDEVRLLEDRRLRVVAPELRERIRDRLRRGGGYAAQEHARLVARLVEQERRHRNVEGGYWIASDLPAAAHQALTGSLPATVRAVALLTDGLGRALEPLGLYRTPAQLILALTAPRGLAAVLEEVRAAEARDPGGQRHPRTSGSDDATALLWRISGP